MSFLTKPMTDVVSIVGTATAPFPVLKRTAPWMVVLMVMPDLSGDQFNLPDNSEIGDIIEVYNYNQFPYLHSDTKIDPRQPVTPPAPIHPDINPQIAFNIGLANTSEFFASNFRNVLAFVPGDLGVYGMMGLTLRKITVDLWCPTSAPQLFFPFP